MAMLNSASAEDKKKQLRRWFSDEELNELTRLENVKEVVRTDNTYPNLYSQMSYSMENIARIKDEMLSTIDEISQTSGFAEIAEMLLDSVPSVLREELHIEDSEAETEPEQYVSAKLLIRLSNSIYLRISAAKSLLKIADLKSHIRDCEDVIALSKNRVLI